MKIDGNPLSASANSVIRVRRMSFSMVGMFQNTRQEARLGENVHLALRIHIEGDESDSPRKVRVEITPILIDEPMCRTLKRWLSTPIHGDGLDRCCQIRTRGVSGCRRLPSAMWVITGGDAGIHRQRPELNDFTPYTLRYFFTERFSGQPTIRRYILEEASTTFWFEQLVVHYRNSIDSAPRLYLSTWTDTLALGTHIC